MNGMGDRPQDAPPSRAAPTHSESDFVPVLAPDSPHAIFEPLSLWAKLRLRRRRIAVPDFNFAASAAEAAATACGKVFL
jgi:hypothetical protein